MQVYIKTVQKHSVFSHRQLAISRQQDREHEETPQQKHSLLQQKARVSEKSI